jgi:hypothetical protein
MQPMKGEQDGNEHSKLSIRTRDQSLAGGT